MSTFGRLGENGPALAALNRVPPYRGHMKSGWQVNKDGSFALKIG